MQLEELQQIKPKSLKTLLEAIAKYAVRTDIPSPKLQLHLNNSAIITGHYISKDIVATEEIVVFHTFISSDSNSLPQNITSIPFKNIIAITFLNPEDCKHILCEPIVSENPFGTKMDFKKACVQLQREFNEKHGVDLEIADGSIGKSNSQTYVEELSYLGILTKALNEILVDETGKQAVKDKIKIIKIKKSVKPEIILLDSQLIISFTEPLNPTSLEIKILIESLSKQL